MKNLIKGSLVSFIILLFSCGDDPTSISSDDNKSQEVGKIAFQIDMTNAPSQVVDLRGILFRDGYDSIPFNFFYDDTAKSASVNIENIPTGNWDLQVDALNIDSVVVYSGSTNILVEPATLTTVNLYLSPISGSLIISVEWGDKKSISDLDEYLIGYWDFEDNGIYDLSSTNNNGRIFGNTSFTNGKKGNAINFIGYNGYAEIPNNEIYNTDKKTISFWMLKNNDLILETEGKVDAEGILGKAYDSGFNRDFTFAISGNKEKFHIYGTIGTEADELIVSGKTQSISSQTWYHCALVIENDYTKFFLNGNLCEVSYKENVAITSSAPIVLGKAFVSSLPTRYFNGKIDELRIYNKALDANDVQLLYRDAL